VAWVLLQKGDAQGQLGEFSSAIETYDEAITRIGDSDTPELLRWISLVLSQKGDTQGKLGEFASAIATYDEAIARIGDSSNPQDMVILVLARKGMRQIEMGHTGEALHTCEEIERKLGVLADDDKMRFALRVIWMRMQVLLVQGQHQAAMDTFRSAYAVFVPGNETMMYWMQRIVLDLVVAGASTRELVEILESDSVKSDALVPLIVALRRYTGEAVRAPEEIFEVATDILKRIGERMAGDAGVDSDDLASLSDFVEGDRE
ncbi:MAG: hypothetical protein F4Y00_03005, partial [Bacteroidetes bacterium SB0662_bin_6]|nr:hypothetical protein [Bacteroidetes bacterium SB0662_bin_6]